MDDSRDSCRLNFGIHFLLIDMPVAKKLSTDFRFDIEESFSDLRIDVFLASTEIGLSRSRIQTAIKNGEVLLNGHCVKSSYRLKTGDQVSVSIPSPKTVPFLAPAAIDFDIIHEDISLIIVDKPAGLVVHPAHGHMQDTLVNGLCMHCNDLSRIGGYLRPGIVHRLDKDTSGVMLIAKNDITHAFLAEQFKSRKIRKEYIALVHGHFKSDEGEIDLPIGRHPLNRKKMAVVFSKGRSAFTVWRKIEEFDSGFTLISVLPKTGRTHQIRVHMSYIGHPVVGDIVYGFNNKKWWNRRFCNTGSGNNLSFIDRHMLHAKSITFRHPCHKKYVTFDAPVPHDMLRAIHVLKS